MAARSIRRPGRIATAALLLLASGFGALDWWIMTKPIDLAPLRSEVAAADGSVAVPPEVKPFPPITQFSEIQDRPLFAPDRRPAKPATTQIAETTVTAPDASTSMSLHLAGIMLENGAGRALIRSGDGSPGEWIAVGEEIDGWHLEQVTALTAELVSDGKHMTLQLYGDDGAAGSTPGPPAGAPAATVIPVEPAVTGAKSP